MQRNTFILRVDDRDAALAKLAKEASRVREAAKDQRIENFSLWNVSSLLLGYGEHAGEGDALPVIQALVKGEIIAPTGSMRLMYHDLGIVRADKSLIRHRVFVTRLKPNCEEAYKRRHDALVAARGDAVSEGPDSNFTIWYGGGYIFGYCEKVKAFDRPMTEAERKETVAWETRQLEIMDWLTDDVDWITGERHEKIQRII